MNIKSLFFVLALTACVSTIARAQDSKVPVLSVTEASSRAFDAAKLPFFKLTGATYRDLEQTSETEYSLVFVSKDFKTLDATIDAQGLDALKKAKAIYARMVDPKTKTIEILGTRVTWQGLEMRPNFSWQ